MAIVVEGIKRLREVGILGKMCHVKVENPHTDYIQWAGPEETSLAEKLRGVGRPSPSQRVDSRCCSQDRVPDSNEDDKIWK